MGLWTQDISMLDIDADDPMYDWLVKPVSVTQSLKLLCENLIVKVISQCLDAYDSLIRQVYLVGDGIAWSYGKVEVPKATYQKFKSQFDTLGNRSIGEVILHKNPNTKRSPFEYSRVEVDSDLFSMAVKNLPVTINQALWARRAMYSIDGFELLVTEVFLPGIPIYRNTPTRAPRLAMSKL